MEAEILPLEQHIDLLLNGKAHSVPCDEEEEELDFPKWFDIEKYKRGQKYMQDNIFVQFKCMLSGLIVVLAVPSILSILIKSYRSSTVETSYRRYLSTYHHVYSWITDDIKPGSKSWRSLTAVRGRHLKASKNSLRRGNGHISQRDMALTQFGFCGFYFLRCKNIGVSETDFEDYLHFWRTVGYMLGIEDRFNICRPSVEESKQLFDVICREVYTPLLISPPEYFYNLVSIMLESMWYINPITSKLSAMYITYAMAGIPGFSLAGLNNNENNNEISEYENKKYSLSINNNIISKDFKKCDNTDSTKLNVEQFVKKLSSYDRFLINFFTSVKNYWLKFSLGKYYLNSQIHLIVFLTDKFPFLCFKRFGWKKSFVNMFEEDLTEFAELKTNQEMGFTF